MATAETGVVEAGPATETTDIDFQELQVISTDELQALRGGFEFAGLQFDFGANLRTFVDGRLALETIIKYTETGVLTQHLPASPTNTPGRTAPAPTVAGTGSPATTSPPATGNAAGGGTQGSVQVLGAGQGPSPADLYLPNIDLSAMKDATGVLINDRKGAVLALHEATRDRITSMVVNQATGRDIRQEVDINVTIQNFRQFQDALRGAILSGRIGSTQR
ncbi:MAG: hypothetical protein HZB57_05235 [Gammaproteobacteria bacterium]|nr:hypothetical protein [Gammaproteobacteria bacterium]